MKRLLVGLAVGLVCAGHPVLAEETNADYYDLSGTVKDPDGRPLNCKLDIDRDRPPVGSAGTRRSVTKDALNGMFKCRLKEGHQYLLRFSHPAYPDVYVVRDYSGTNSSKRKERIRVVMGRGLTIRGTLVSGDRPVSGYYVIGNEGRDEIDLSPYALGKYGTPGVTSNDGHFVVRGVRPGILTLEAYTSTPEDTGEYPRAVAKLRLLVSPSGKHEVIFDMGVLGAVTGRVLDSSNQCITNARVMIQPTRSSKHGRALTPETSRITDSSGAFAFQAVCPGTYTISARHRDTMVDIAPKQTVVMDNGKTIPVMLTTWPPAYTWTMTGQLTTNGILASEGRVRIQFHGSGPLSRESEAAVSKSGSFVLTNATTGAYRAKYLPRIPDLTDSNLRQYAGTWQPIQIPDDQTNLTLNFMGVSVSGVLMDSQNLPLTNQRIMMATHTTNMTGTCFSSELSDANGHFRFELIPTGTYSAGLLDGSGRSNSIIKIDPTDSFHTVRIPWNVSSTDCVKVSGSISGEFGEPLDFVLLKLTSSNAHGSTWSGRIAGQFAFHELLPMGRYELTACLDGFFPLRRTVYLTSDTNLNVRMKLSGSVLVRTIRHDNPVSNVVIRAYDTHHAEIASTTAGQVVDSPDKIWSPKTDVFGMALLEGLPVGTCIIKADGYETESTVEIRPVETVSTTLELP